MIPIPTLKTCSVLNASKIKRKNVLKIDNALKKSIKIKKTKIKKNCNINKVASKEALV